MAATEAFSVTQARSIVRDLFVHRPAVYWTDFLVSLTIGYTAASVYLVSPLFSLQQIVAYLLAGFAFFRVASFIHEIVHMTGRQLLAFRIAWNVLAGIPMLIPSFFYGNHIDHHSSRHYGTGQDGEYLPIGRGALKEILHFYLQVVFLPIAVFLRFLVITPISFLHPRLRQWALERTSSFVINLRYRREIPASAPRRVWAAIEICCFLRALALVIVVLIGRREWTHLLLLYSLALMTLGLNYIRNLIAHRYRSAGDPISHVEQLADSVNIQGVPLLTELFFPLSLRYHALHHLFPTLPYHNLARGHRRLLAQLPAGSLYHQTVFPGFWAVARQVVVRALLRQRGQLRDESGDWYARRKRLLAARVDREASGGGRSRARRSSTAA